MRFKKIHVFVSGAYLGTVADETVSEIIDSVCAKCGPKRWRVYPFGDVATVEFF